MVLHHRVRASSVWEPEPNAGSQTPSWFIAAATKVEAKLLLKAALRMAFNKKPGSSFVGAAVALVNGLLLKEFVPD